jgi:hypothetical protein
VGSEIVAAVEYDPGRWCEWDLDERIRRVEIGEASARAALDSREQAFDDLSRSCVKVITFDHQGLLSSAGIRAQTGA